MMTYQTFYDATDIPKCGRGKLLKALGDRVQACDSGVTVAKLIAVLTAASAWGWKKGAKHGEHPTANFNLRLTAIKGLVQTTIQELNQLGVDGQAISKAANSYENHKRKGAKKGLQSLLKGYHFERKGFEASKKAGVTKDSVISPRGGSFVAEALKGAKDLRANFKIQQEAGATPSDTLGANITDQKTLNLLLSKDMHQLSEKEFDTVFQAAAVLSGQNTPEVHFLRKTERVARFLTWCEGGLFHKQDGLPHTSAGREIYAMDKYGNLVTMKPALFFKPASGTYDPHGSVQHNHSSLNAGGDVISAGEIEFQGGQITYIDNASGHYKPTAKQVQNCVYSLRMADDADLSRLTINVWVKGAWKTYNDAGQFLAARF